MQEGEEMLWQKGMLEAPQAIRDTMVICFLPCVVAKNTGVFMQ